MCHSHLTAAGLCSSCTGIYHSLEAFERGRKRNLRKAQDKGRMERFKKCITPLKVVSIFLVLCLLATMYFYVFPQVSIMVEALLIFLGIILLGFTVLYTCN
jgi:hypothetical protein